MQVDYCKLSNQTKVFVYPSSRKFYDEEIGIVEEKISTFLDKYFKNYNYSFKILYSRFIVFFISEEKPISLELLDIIASFIIELEEEYDIILLDKINVCFKQGKFVQYQDMKRFRELIKKRSISKKTIVFNNLVQNKQEFEEHFETPASESWLSYLF